MDSMENSRAQIGMNESAHCGSGSIMPSIGANAMNEDLEKESLFRRASAWVPLVMSLAALAFLLGYVAVAGIAQTTDEGPAARIFQLIMIAQLPIAAWFAITWLTRRPKQSLLVLAVQAIAWMVPIAAVLWMESL